MCRQWNALRLRVTRGLLPESSGVVVDGSESRCPISVTSTQRETAGCHACSVVKPGVKNLLAGEQQAAVTVAVEALMDAKPEAEAFATFDPKVKLRLLAPQVGATQSQCGLHQFVAT